MKEFRVTSNGMSERNRTWRIRVALWSAILALSGITVFTISGAHLGATFTTVLLSFAGLLVIFVVLGAYFLAFSHARELAVRKPVFLLTDTQLIRKKNGYPDIEINLQLMKALYKKRRWLVVESVAPSRIIAIPEEVAGFESLQAELAKYAPIVHSKRVFLGSLMLTFLYFICWAIILWSEDKVVVTIVAAIGVAVLASQSFLIYRQRRNKPRRFLVWGWIGLGWAAAAVAVYFRLMHA